MRRRPLAFVAWSGIVYRVTTYDEPLWVLPNRRDGRWNVAGDGCTQYTCLDAAAPFAEMLRSEGLRTEAESKTFRVALWQLRIDEGAIVDYGTFQKAEDAGFAASALVDDDHEQCQAEARRLKGLNARGLLTPSAALPGSVNLTLFGARSPVAWTTTVKLASSIPTQRLFEGSAPQGLVDDVRQYGDEHRGLVEHEAARKRLPEA